MSTTPNTPNLLDSPHGIPAEPTLLRAGDSWKWCRVFPGFNSGDGWALQYELNSPGGALFPFPAGAITQDADGVGFGIALTPAQTAACVAGIYDFYAVLTQSTVSGGVTTVTQQRTIELESVQVDPNIAGATASVDTRSFAKRTLDMLELAIAGDSSPLVQEYEIQGRRVRYIDRMELIKLRAQFRLEYRQEQIANGEYVPKKVARVAF